MEGNNEIRIDGCENPAIDYLGTEDSFGFSWGFNKEYCGPYSGMNKIVMNENESRLSIYRFLSGNKIRFEKNLEIRINWSNDWANNESFQSEINELNGKGGAVMDYAVTHYWYQKEIGYEHEVMPDLEERIKY